MYQQVFFKNVVFN